MTESIHPAPSEPVVSPEAEAPAQEAKPQKKSRSFPHAIILLLIITLCMAILSWIIPYGTYLSVDANGIVQGMEGFDQSTAAVVYSEATYFNSGVTVNLGPWATLKYIVEGFKGASSIIFLILVAFATLHLLQKTGALDAVIAGCARLVDRKPKAAPVILVFIMYLLAAWGTTGTLSYEEIGAFIPIFLALALALGYDPIVAAAVGVMSMGFGFACGVVNPFTTGTAQSIAGVELFSGMGYRIVILVVTVGILAAYTLRYGAKVRKDPSRSITADLDYSHVRLSQESLQARMDVKKILSLASLVVMIGLMVYTLTFAGGGVDDVTALFLALAIVLTVVNWWSPSQAARLWVQGLSTAVYPAIIVGFGYGVSYVMAYGGIKDPIVHWMSALLGGANLYIGVVGMMLFQWLLNFFIPSGSGQAAVAMPLMAPIAESIGLSKQVAVLAFQFGDGFSNLLWPTSMGVVLPVLAGIPVGRYIKWLLKLFAYVIVALILFLWIGILIGY